MSRFYIQTDKVTSIIQGKQMFLDDGYLYIYGDDDGKDLRGMYKAEIVSMAYRTEEKEGGRRCT